MKLDLSDCTVERVDVDDDQDDDVLLEITYTNGSYSDVWAMFRFRNYGGRLDVWEYIGEDLKTDDSRSLSTKVRYDIFLLIIDQTDCLAIVGTTTDGDEVYCTNNAWYPTSDFESADEFVRYLILSDDFEDSEAVERFFDTGEKSGFSLLGIEIQNTRAAMYYKIREKYERHFAEMSGDPLRERVADEFAEKHDGHVELAEWASGKREEHGLRV